MRRSPQLSAAQLAALSVLGGLIAACSFFATFNPWTLPRHTSPHFTALLTLQLVLLLAGGLIAFRSATSLESGIALFIGFVLLVIIIPRFRPAGWSLYLLMLTFNFLRSNIRRKAGPAPESKWINLSPIRSEHWGQH